jgi:DNA-binding transcriptional regulator YdaS (Cro superfamily)
MERLAEMETDTPLRRWRKASKLTPQQAADHIGVTVPMWSRWENQARDVPAVRVLDIEAKTGVSRHELRPDVFGAEEAAA